MCVHVLLDHSHGSTLDYLRNFVSFSLLLPIVGLHAFYSPNADLLQIATLLCYIWQILPRFKNTALSL